MMSRFDTGENQKVSHIKKSKKISKATNLIYDLVESLIDTRAEFIDKIIGDSLNPFEKWINRLNILWLTSLVINRKFKVVIREVENEVNPFYTFKIRFVEIYKQGKLKGRLIEAIK